ncbi:MAG: alkaline phosphatase family protein [Bryobacterales bacterium]|nr:alkaline phosphatase family protein [Bryobacterales bacterium]
MIVLGIDGMDPVFVERHWSSLPNLARLRQDGGFAPLATTMPPQSPVAWSTFITGLGPDGHGIYDFVHRDARTRQPVSSMNATRVGRRLMIGPYRLPLTADRVVNHRRGAPFWQTLAGAGVNATMLRMPTDFPPVECEAHALAGMGAPDLLGTFGTFSFFTDRPEWHGRALTGGVVLPVRVQQGSAVLALPGPANSLRRDGSATRLVIGVAVDATEPVARFEVGGQLVVLQQGETSGWIPVRFPLLGHLAEARGMVRIYAKELHPHLSIYVSPVNADPRDPALPISHPTAFGRELAEAAGEAFYTQGMPYDTAAFRHGVFSREEYRAHSREVSRQTLGLLRAALARPLSGVLFFHFFGVDQDAHMLWGRYDDELLETYRLVDEAVGWVRTHAPAATLVVMSDHGFARFDRAVHLNTWLLREGFLTLQSGADPARQPDLANVDWTRTQAYALGLNSIYLNAAALPETAGEIQARLLTLRDAANGATVVTGVARAPGGDDAPDLLVGYAAGYRASWQTALGGIEGAIVEDNRDEWRGDHCLDPRVVPGVLLSNRRFSHAPAPRIEDLTVTILETFGVAKAPGMTGRNLFR